ncbi:MFS general substrate transporter [Rhizopogon vinicolor AM-OR11-026]|uniref:MFS general substrate transporter n=1 Tax=Rhizopogon vinicolor AM-OR11-026 TaxID=1314800 RepID=A0A1B7N6F1_9AGAM|nr:MFS general substrate transporter [Rhizopogon vinicolor AM-OR11-026]
MRNILEPRDRRGAVHSFQLNLQYVSPDRPAQRETLVNDRPNELPLSRKVVLLAISCLAQFLDVFNASALFSALPALEMSMRMTESQSTWMISAFQLTFASFLLISGRISDVYNPKNVFIGGVASLGIISLCVGFVDSKVPMIICRELIGIASSMTIPPALTLLVNIFPDPLQQAQVIALFGGCGGVANVLGLLIGAMFVQWASYHWVFWFVAILAVPAALACVYIIPPQITKTSTEPEAAKWKSLDLVGVSILTVALILFIFAVTFTSTDGWASATVLAPLIISISMIVAFFYWETCIPVEKAAITWFLILTNLWQNIFHWSVISMVIHLIPIGIVGFAASFTGSLSHIFSPKWIILTALSMCMVAAILLALGGGEPENYWPYMFPALVVGTAGGILTYVHANIVIFQVAPSSMAGTVGATFNGTLQCGSAVGLAAVTSIETSVEATHGGPQEYAGRATAFWFLLGIVVLEFISISIFYDRSTDHKPQPTHDKLVDPAQQSTQSDEKFDNLNAAMPEINKKADQVAFPV